MASLKSVTSQCLALDPYKPEACTKNLLPNGNFGPKVQSQNKAARQAKLGVV
jgi:hypothetical protein